jgi:hypothetical protein
MNEDIKCIVKSSVLMGCCPEETPCGSCSPKWQRTIVIDDTSSCWFPVIGMTNKVLKKIIKSEGGMLIDRANGAWYVDEKLALDIAENKKERDNLESMMEKIKEKYNSSLGTANKSAEVDELA